jgi:hypothetical protein
MTRKIYLYGRLRDAGLGDFVSLDLPPGATARRALAALKGLLGRRGALLTGCALATDEAVLSPSDLVPKSGALAALPPVCGG